MSATAYLHQPLTEGRAIIDCEEIEVRGNVAWLTPTGDEQHVVVPLENLAGVEGDDVEQAVDTLPTQGGQYSEVVTRLE